jgi:hypothetical protein
LYRVRYYPRFQASAVGLGTYHPRIREDYCNFKYKFHIHIGIKIYSWGNKNFTVIAIAFESAVLQNKILLFRLVFLRMRDCIDVLMEVVKQVIFLQMAIMEESWILLK